MSKITDPDLLKQLNAAEVTGDPTPVAGGWQFGDAVDLLQGVSQGLIDPIEGITQLAEKSTGWHIAPQAVKDWARNYRKQARSTMLGVGGEVAGNIVPGVLGGEVGEVPMVARALSGAALGAAQPVSGGGNYRRTKMDQAIWGGLGGAALPAVAGLAGRAAPYLAHAAAAAHGIPRAVLHGLRGLAYIPSGLSDLASQVPGGTYGRVIGMAQGRSPIETPSGRLYITPQKQTTAPPPSADDDKSADFQERFTGDAQ